MKVKARFGIGSRELWITDDEDEYRRWVFKHLRVETPAMSKQIQGRTYGGIVWVRNFECIPFLVHEVIHATDNWMEDIGISNDTEVRAYVVQQLIETIIKAVSKKASAL